MPTLQFKGKALVQNHHLVVPFSELEAVKSQSLSKSPALYDNLIIEGDNLKALKALLPAYQGKIKCVYIDPPYNTGNESWVYNDKVNSPMMRDWLGKTVDRDDLTRHDKWCCMMMPRLKLLRELLSDDGAIFISIDDNEVHHLRGLMDEVFGEENFVAQLVWQKRNGGGNDSTFIAVDHEYILIFARNLESQAQKWRIDYEEEYLKRYREEDAVSRYYWDTLSRPNLRNPIVYDVECPDGTTIKSGQWQISKPEFLRKKDSGDIRIIQDKKENWTVHHKVRQPDGRVFRSLLKEETNTDAAAQLQTIFSDNKVFSSPKPTGLIKSLLKLMAENDDIILDSFAGSGTTAHAVLALNKEDGGSRRFILCQMPYETKEQEAKKENICERVTAERVRRVIKGVSGAKDANLKSGLGGTFSYFKLGKELHRQSILDGKELPSYEALAGYVFFTATGHEFDPKKIKRRDWFVGASGERDVFLIYEADVEKLKDMALGLDLARTIAKYSLRRKLIFAPTKYLDGELLDNLGLEFCQLPFEIYRHASK